MINYLIDEDECVISYTFSEIKLASWFCLDWNFDLQQYLEKDNCYVNFFGGDEAIKNG